MPNARYTPEPADGDHWGFRELRLFLLLREKYFDWVVLSTVVFATLITVGAESGTRMGEQCFLHTKLSKYVGKTIL